MAEWRTFSVELPPEIQDALDKAASTLDVAANYMDAVAVALDAVASIAAASLDTYTTLVNAFVDLVQNFLQDIKAANVYVLVDYPQGLNVAFFNPASKANLAGTALDVGALRYTASSDASSTTPQDQRPGENRLQAIARARTDWNPVARSMIGYSEAIERIVGAFSDTEDENRPLFSNDAATFGFVAMVHSTELASFLKLLKVFTDLFALSDLEQVAWPGLQSILDADKPFDQFNEQELDLLDLTVPLKFRSGGQHPNFVMKTTLLDLVPVLRDLVDALDATVEQLRPNGDLKQFIRDVIEAYRRKIQRLRDLSAQLRAVADTLRNLLDGTAFSYVFILSNAGNAGFTAGLRSSTGHPEFDQALVASVLVYGGGPAMRAFQTFFGVGGEAQTSVAALEQTVVENSAAAVVALASVHAGRPVVP